MNVVQNDNMPALDKLIAWRRLNAPVLTMTFDAMWHHQATMS